MNTNVCMYVVQSRRAPWRRDSRYDAGEADVLTQNLRATPHVVM